MLSSNHQTSCPGSCRRRHLQSRDRVQMKQAWRCRGSLGKTSFQQQRLRVNMQTRLIERSRVAPSGCQGFFLENEDGLGLGALSADRAGGLLTWGIRHSGLPLRCWKGAQIELVLKSRVSFHRCHNVLKEASSRLASRDRQHWLN